MVGFYQFRLRNFDVLSRWHNDAFLQRDFDMSQWFSLLYTGALHHTQKKTLQSFVKLLYIHC